MRYFVTGICLLFVGVAFSQEETPNRVVEQNFAVKFTPTQMAVGELNFGIEIKTTKRTSIELEFGPTISEIGFGAKQGDGKWKDEPDSLFLPQYNVEANSGIGYFGALGFRYYPIEQQQAIKGLYVMPQVKYRVYNSILEETSGNWEDLDVQRSQIKFHFNVGYQLWASQHFGFDFFLGGGMGFDMGTKATPIVESFPSGTSYRWEEEEYSKPRFLFVGGIKIIVGS